MNYPQVAPVLVLMLMAGCAGAPTVAPAPQKVATAPAAPTETPAMADQTDVAGNIETSADEDERMICRTFMPTGSHRKKTVCRSVGEIKRDRRSAQDALRRNQSGTATDPGDL